MTTSTCQHHAAPSTHDEQARATPRPDAPAGCASHDPFEKLAACHQHVLGTLAELERALADLRGPEPFSDRLRATVGDTLTLIQVAIPLHSADEEQTLFPRLRERAPFADAPHTPMDCMESDHVEHREMAASLARASMKRDAAALERAARNLIAEYREHISKEDEVLFPMARELLTDPAELAEMAREMHERRVAARMLSC